VRVTDRNAAPALIKVLEVLDLDAPGAGDKKTGLP
jgi:hypothetical protein